MTKNALLPFFLVIAFMNSLFASHIIGGEIYYDYKSQIGNKHTYVITTILYRDEKCISCAQLNNHITLGVYNNDNNLPFNTITGSAELNSNLIKNETVRIGNVPKCLVNDPQIYCRAYTYRCLVDLPENKKGYTIVFQTCCRIEHITNISNNDNNSIIGQGSTYFTQIPGTDSDRKQIKDRSPRFLNELSVICHEHAFKMNLAAEDPDGDELRYFLCPSYNSGKKISSLDYVPPAPPYQSVQYLEPYSGEAPMGTQIRLDPKTGSLSGIAPTSGKYLLTVCVQSFRNGKLITTNFKDIIITVAPCDFPGSSLNETYLLCNTLTGSFSNLNSSPLNRNNYWNFGDPSSFENERFGTNVVHRFSKPGDYYITLTTNKDMPCADSAVALVHVSGKLKADFDVNKNPGVTNDFNFLDRSVAETPSDLSRHWDFGVANRISDTGYKTQERFSFPESGQYEVKLTIKTLQGCEDAVTRLISTDQISGKEKKSSETLNHWTLLFSSDLFLIMPEYENVLSEVAGFLLEHPKAKADLRGYADNTGSRNHNLTLSRKRAAAVADYLLLKGVSYSQLAHKGLGAGNPIGDNNTEEGKKNNRRVEIQLLED